MMVLKRKIDDGSGTLISCCRRYFYCDNCPFVDVCQELGRPNCPVITVLRLSPCDKGEIV